MSNISNTKSMVSEKLKGGLSGPQVQTVDVHVDFRIGMLMETYSAEFCAGLEVMHPKVNVLEYLSGALSEELQEYLVSNDCSLEDLMVGYFDYLLGQRVLQVNGRKTEIRPGDFSTRIPVFVHFLLSQIGRVHIKTKQVWLLPEYTMTSPIAGLFNKLDVAHLSRRLESIAPAALAKALPKDIEGEADFMALATVSNVVMGDSTLTEPVLSFAHSVVIATRDTVALTSHVSYGRHEDFGVYIPEMAHIGLGVG